MSDLNPRTQRYLDLLDNVLDIAHDVLKQIHAQVVTPQDPPIPDVDRSIPIERVARTIRRTILLAQKLAEPPKPERVAPKPDRRQARKRIIREVEDHIHRTITNEAEVSNLQADLLDRLDSPELEDEIDTRPVPDIIIDIVRDLGLDSNWGPHRFKPRTQADIAALAARAAECRPEQPPPLRGRPRPPRPRHILPADPAQAVATVLRYGLARDG